MARRQAADAPQHAQRSSAARRLLGRRGLLYAIAIVLSAILLVPVLLGVHQLAQAATTRSARLPPVIFPSRWLRGELRRGLDVASCSASGPATALLDRRRWRRPARCSRRRWAATAFARFRFPGREHPVRPDDRDDDAAGHRHADPALHPLLPARLDEHLPAADRAVLVRRRAFFIFLFRQFFMTIPPELDEAAKIDGASYLQIFARIILPLSGPVVRRSRSSRSSSTGTRSSSR